MEDPKILVVYKESAYRRFLSSKSLVRSLKKGNYWKIIQGSHERQGQALASVRGVLRSLGLSARWISRDQARRLTGVDRRYGLVVSVGGDGTLLDLSHCVGKVPVLGVNSDPKRSVARFSGCDAASFGKVLEGYLRGRLRPLPVWRLEFSINGRKCPWLVLNDLLVAALSPAGTSRYVLRAGARAEEQMSSGLWISTAAGSTAAILSAGGRKLPLASAKLQFVVREAYQKKFGPRRLLKGVLGRGGKLEVLSRMKEGRVFVDGANFSVPFGLGDKLAVRISRQPLWIVGLRK